MPGSPKRHSILALALLPAAVCLLCVWAYRTAPVSAQQAPPPGKQASQPASGGRAFAAPDDNTGFEAIFDGKTLGNWDGDPAFWRAENGEIIGESTPEKVVKVNTFLIWKGGVLRDFELKADFKLSEAANSGIQYRSSVLPEAGKWTMKGYQADMDGNDTYTGQLYEERARGFLAMRGQFTRMMAGRVQKLVGSLGEPAALKEFIRKNDWNRIHIVAKGNVLIHSVNGRVMAMFLDDDPEGRAMEGQLGLQLHMGQPMKNEFRNIYYKKLP
jgi:hypothetical protein